MGENGNSQNDLMFRTVVATSLDGIGICTLPDLRFIYVNDAFVNMTGIARGALIGHTVPEFNLGPGEAAYAEIRRCIERDGFVRDLVLQLS